MATTSPVERNCAEPGYASSGPLDSLVVISGGDHQWSCPGVPGRCPASGPNSLTRSAKASGPGRASRGSRRRCSPMMSVSAKSLGVKTARHPSSRSDRGVAGGMIPPTTTGTSPAPPSRRPSSTAGTSARCEPDRIDSPTSARPRRPRPRRSAPGSAGCPGRPPRSRRRGPVPRSARRRWSARPGPACRPAAAAGRPSSAPVGPTRSRTAASSAPPRPSPPRPTPGRGAVLPEHLPQRPGPLPRRHPGAGARQRRRHQVRVDLRVAPAAASSAPPHRAGPASARPARRARPPPRLRLAVDGLHGRVEVGGQRGRLGFGEAVDADDDSPRRTRSVPAARARPPARLHVAGLDRGDRATHHLHPVHLPPRAPSTSSATFASTTSDPSNRSSYSSRSDS